MFELKLFIAACLLFTAYRRLGYYRRWFFLVAIWKYYREKKRLCAQVLTENRWGIPVGTLMCSVDRGWLPADEDFPSEMDKLRVKFVGITLGYLGKFAVWPHLKGQSIGRRLMIRAVCQWSQEAGVQAVIILADPEDVRKYRKFGAIEVARTKETKGLVGAESVLMYLIYADSEQIKRRRTSLTLPAL